MNIFSSFCKVIPFELASPSMYIHFDWTFSLKKFQLVIRIILSLLAQSFFTECCDHEKDVGPCWLTSKNLCSAHCYDQEIDRCLFINVKVKFNNDIFGINCIKPRRWHNKRGINDHFTKAGGTLVRQFLLLNCKLNWGKGQRNYQPSLGGRQFRLEIRACKP